jgi:hypothetical protein
LVFFTKNTLENDTGVAAMAKIPNEKPNPERVAVLRSLPLEVKELITGEEAEAFMYDRELPDSLLEKLKEYLTEEKP